MEGFLSLEEAAKQLETSPELLSQEISEGKVVAIVKDSRSWLSPGEVSRLLKSRTAEAQAKEPVAAPVAPQPDLEETVPPVSSEEEQKQKDDSHQVASPTEKEQELSNRCHQLSRQVQDLEGVNQRLKTGLQETEATLRRSRTAKTNLENDIISLQEQLKKAQSRSSALEREVQHLTHELERAEDKHSSELRKMRTLERGGGASSGGEQDVDPEELAALRQQMLEKDRIISQEYQERAVLRSQLEERSQKYFELKARYEKEKSEWSEMLARGLQTQGQLKSQLEELRPKTQKGWNPFRRDK